MKKKVMLTIVAIVAMAAVSNAGVIFSETFDGDGTSGVDGTTTPVGGAAWEAESDFLQTDGAVLGGGVNEAWAGGAFIPFNPVAGNIYTLSMDINHTGSNLADLKYVGMGFSSDGVGDRSKKDSGYRLPQNGGIGLYEYGNGGGITLMDKGGSGKVVIANNGTYVGQQWVNLKMVLDVSGDGSSFTIDFLLNDVSITVDGPFAYARSIDDINYAAIDSYGTRNGSSPVGTLVDNFELSSVAVPEPATIALLTLGGLVIRRTRRKN